MKYVQNTLAGAALTMTLIIAYFAHMPAASAANCAFDTWQSYKNTKLYRNQNQTAYAFVTEHKAIDADGAPNAYHPNNTGLDDIANAGYPNSRWWKDVLVPDPVNSKRAYRQADGAFKGYFVSKTAFLDKANTRSIDPDRYLDARHVPYFVFPGKFFKMKGTGKMGDIGIAINTQTNQRSPFVIGDIGPFTNPLGEISISLAERLGGINVNPRNGSGAPQGKILYLVMPYTVDTHPISWPPSAAQLDRLTRDAIKQKGIVFPDPNCIK